MARFDRRYEDVLLNIETALVQSYREHSEITDWEARVSRPYPVQLSHGKRNSAVAGISIL
jgi:hypothetical protein